MRISMMYRSHCGLLMAALLAFLSGCASTGIGPISDGANAGTGAAPASIVLTGTLANVDHQNRRLLLAVDQGGAQDLEYDQTTRVYAPASLKPGDRIRVQATRMGRLWHAHSIDPAVGGATFDSKPAGQAPDAVAPNADTPVRTQGVVSALDANARVIEFTEGGVTGGERRASYDADTEVEFQNAAYPIASLQRGDLISLQLRRSERGWIAERIVVEQRTSDH